MIVVTGVSRGLGRAMTEGFIKAGHVVAGCARSADAIADLESQFGLPHRFDAVDLANSGQIEKWSASILKELGPPDVLVNSAAVIKRNAPLWAVLPAEFSHVIDVNIKGVFHTIHYLVPAMVQRGRGVIVNFSSYWGRSTSADVAAYCTTKWAIEGLSRGLADDLPDGLASVALNPGIIHTDMLTSCFGASAASYPDPQQWASAAVPYILELGPGNNGQSVTVPGF
jgi:NAD(P)-dependent dehydrogenase (short-subunit alcohol dehydrogenase family)